MRLFAISCLLVCVAAPLAHACDLCGCYTPQSETLPQNQSLGQPMVEMGQHPNFYAAVAEQFTHFGTVQIDGHEIPNPTDQHLDSSITQVVIGYQISDRFALQLNVPFIYRAFRRPEGFAIEEGSESGIGDVSLLAKFVAWRYQSGGGREFRADGKNVVAMEHEPDFTASLIALGGIKFPTGATGRIKEEFNETEIPGAPASGIHGHDLTLGTGSYDGIFGGQCSLRWKSAFFEADTQFTFRSDGAHDYAFANDLAWSVVPVIT